MRNFKSFVLKGLISLHLVSSLVIAPSAWSKGGDGGGAKEARWNEPRRDRITDKISIEMSKKGEFESWNLTKLESVRDKISGRINYLSMREELTGRDHGVMIRRLERLQARVQKRIDQLQECCYKLPTFEDHKKAYEFILADNMAQLNAPGVLPAFGQTPGAFQTNVNGTPLVLPPPSTTSPPNQAPAPATIGFTPASVAQ